MKYCPKCKIRMPDTATACTQCGGDVRLLGLSGAAAGGNPGDAQPLVSRLQGLQHEVEQGQKNVARLAKVAGVLLALLILLLIVLQVRRVAQYAVVNEVSVVPSATQPGTADISYSPASTGKIEFTRTTPERTETLTEFAPPPGTAGSNTHFAWAGKSTTYSIRITYRSGWRIIRQEWSAPGK